MPITLKGSVLPFLQNESYHFSPSQGYLYTADFKGMSAEQMEALARDFEAQGIACQFTIHQGGMSTLEAEDSTQLYTIDTWQILGNSASVDILSHPQITEILGNYVNGDSMIAELRNGLAFSTAFDKLPPGAIYNLSAGDIPIVSRAYSRYMRGSTDYRRGQYVLRHSTNVPNRWANNISDIGVDCIYSPAELFTEVQDSGLWTFPLPGRLIYKLATIPPLPPQPFYQWGWLKSASTETTAANNRVDISTEYTLELWSTDEYSPLSS